MLKKQGYDGAEFPDTAAWEGMVEGRFDYPQDDTTVAIWNTDKIKTKKQLAELWEQVNQKRGSD